MTPMEIYLGSDGEATKALYARLEAAGPIGAVAMNLFLTERDGDGLEIPRSTSDLSVTEFTKYIEHCQQFAAENGVIVPDPGEVTA